MRLQWLLLAVVLISLIQTLYVDGTPQTETRKRSRFRIQGIKNGALVPKTQPDVIATIRTTTSASPLAPKVRKSSAAVQPNKLTRRRGSLAAQRTSASAKRTRTQRPTTGGGGLASSRSKRRRLNSLAGSRRVTQVESNAIDNDVSSRTGATNYKVVCYYTNWGQYREKVGKFTPENIDPTLCTHIIYAFGWMKGGKLSASEANDLSQDGKVGGYEKVTAMKRKNKNLKIMLAVGGWSFGTKRFQDMAKNRYTRQIFITNAIPYLRKHKYDGLDLDWEYPKGNKDKANFVLLLQGIREAFESESVATGKPRLILSAAVPVGPDNIRSGYDVPRISKYLDFINLMSYDFHGKWENTVGHNAPMHAPSTDSDYRKQLSVTNAAKIWVLLGAPKEKLIIGMPSYGRSFTLTDPSRYIVNQASTGGGEAGKYTGEEGSMAYYEVCEHLRSGGAYVWDEEMQVPYMVKGNLWVGFDDERSIRNKMDFIINNGYGGAMVWTLDMDDFTGTVCGGNVKYPLISIMSEMLLKRPRNGKDIDWTKVAKVLPPTQTFQVPASTQLTTGDAAGIKQLTSNNFYVPAAAKEAPKVMCYYTSWSSKRPGAGRFEPENLDPFQCTHIIYAFATMKEFQLAPMQQSDISDGLQPGTFERIVKLKEKNPALKVLLALGGWQFGSEPFKELVSNNYHMSGFVYGSIEFLREHSFDGLDVDWEYPSGPDDKANFVKLIKELRLAYEGEADATGHPRLLVTAAVPASFEALAAGYDVPELSKYLDYFNVMTYDFHGQWEETVGHNSPLLPLEGAPSLERKLTVDFSLREWIKQGAPAQKILMGVAAYGRSFTLANATSFDIGAPALRGGNEGRYTKEEGFMSYYEICDFLFEDNTTLVWDNEQQVPFAYNGDQWVGFDDERSVGVKMEWIKSNGIGGVMVWSADMDDFRGNCGGGFKYPLLTAISEGLGNYTVALNYDGPYENKRNLDGTITKKDPNAVNCEDGEGHISYHEDSVDCTKYYMCEGERKHHMPCPVNLVYNAQETVCDWPANVPGCENAITSG